MLRASLIVLNEKAVYRCQYLTIRSQMLWLAAVVMLFVPIGRSWSSELVLGVFPRRDPILTMSLFTPLGNYLSTHLDRPVRVETAANFKSFMQRVSEGRYDLVHLNQYQYIQIHQSSGFEAIAQNEEQGEATIRSAIFVRADAPIETLSDLRGKRIVFGGGPDAMMSYIVPSYLLHRAGLKKGDYQELFAISPPNAFLAAYFGQAEACGVGHLVFRLKVVSSRVSPDGMRLLAVSEPMAHLPWAIHPKYSKTLKNRIQALLVGLKRTEEGRSVLAQARLSGINVASDKDYALHRDIIKQVVGGAD